MCCTAHTSTIYSILILHLGSPSCWRKNLILLIMKSTNNFSSTFCQLIIGINPDIESTRTNILTVLPFSNSITTNMFFHQWVNVAHFMFFKLLTGHLTPWNHNMAPMILYFGLGRKKSNHKNNL